VKALVGNVALIRAGHAITFLPRVYRAVFMTGAPGEIARPLPAAR
jgi:hypothetical protein